MKRLCGVSLLELPKRFSTAIVAKACAMSDISRRDFINGVGLTIASGLTPIDQIGAAAQIYPPALIGLSGDHPGSFQVAHGLVREQKTFSLTALPVGEHYDLVVAGGGISGLADTLSHRALNAPARP